MKTIVFTAITALFCAPLALAGDKWRISVAPGITFATETAQTARIAGVSFSGTSYSRPSFEIGAEVSHNFELPKPGLMLGLFAGYGFTKESPSDGSNGESISIITLGGRLAKRNGIFEPWASFGLGVSVITLGDSGARSGDFYISAASNTHAGFALSPKIGADFHLGNDVFLGPYIGFTRVSTTVDGNIFNVASSSRTPISIDAVYTWFSFAVRVGASF
jgi:hypothetical protein